MRRSNALAGSAQDADEDIIICLKRDKNNDFKLEYAGIRSEGKLNDH